MIAAGAVTAAFALIAFAISRKERHGTGGQRTADRHQIAASILHQVLISGGMPSYEALRRLRRSAGLAAPVTPGADVASWAESYVGLTTESQRHGLLETAVRLVSEGKQPVPLAQYSALLDLSFALGFHIDALARLREKYGFEYVDHAKNARPREADRAGGAAPLFTRENGDPREWLRVLEIEGNPDRQAIISAYRRLAARHHPDKVDDRSALAQETAAARFIEITRAYERLLAIYRD